MRKSGRVRGNRFPAFGARFSRKNVINLLLLNPSFIQFKKERREGGRRRGGRGKREQGEGREVKRERWKGAKEKGGEVE